MTSIITSLIKWAYESEINAQIAAHSSNPQGGVRNLNAENIDAVAKGILLDTLGWAGELFEKASRKAVKWTLKEKLIQDKGEKLGELLGKIQAATNPRTKQFAESLQKQFPCFSHLEIRFIIVENKKLKKIDTKKPETVHNLVIDIQKRLKQEKKSLDYARTVPGNSQNTVASEKSTTSSDDTDSDGGRGSNPLDFAEVNKAMNLSYSLATTKMEAERKEKARGGCANEATPLGDHVNIKHTLKADAERGSIAKVKWVGNPGKERGYTPSKYPEFNEVTDLINQIVVDHKPEKEVVDELVGIISFFMSQEGGCALVRETNNFLDCKKSFPGQEVATLLNIHYPEKGKSIKLEITMKYTIYASASAIAETKSSSEDKSLGTVELKIESEVKLQDISDQLKERKKLERLTQNIDSAQQALSAAQNRLSNLQSKSLNQTIQDAAVPKETKIANIENRIKEAEKLAESLSKENKIRQLSGSLEKLQGSTKTSFEVVIACFEGSLKEIRSCIEKIEGNDELKKQLELLHTEISNAHEELKKIKPTVDSTVDMSAALKKIESEKEKVKSLLVQLEIDLDTSMQTTKGLQLKLRGAHTPSQIYISP